jgi:S-adenosyl methyltransferase
MTDDSPVPGIDVTVPHSARVWNYWLRGKNNYAVDREAGDRYPRCSRQFLGIAAGLPAVTTPMR